MTKKELKRINQLLTKAAEAKAMSDTAAERGEHSVALTYMGDSSAAMASLYEEFGITNGTHKFHISYSKVRESCQTFQNIFSRSLR